MITDKVIKIPADLSIQLSLWTTAAVDSNSCSRSANGIYNVIFDFIPMLNAPELVDGWYAFISTVPVY